MRVYVHDENSLDFAIAMNFEEIDYPFYKNEKLVHRKQNNFRLSKYIFDSNFIVDYNLDLIGPNVKNFEQYNKFDLIILPLYLKNKLTSEWDFLLNKIAYYGTEEEIDKRDENGNIIKYIDSNNVEWNYVTSPLQSLKFLYKSIEKLNIKVPMKYSFLKSEYLKELNNIKNNFEVNMGMKVPSILFITQSNMDKNKLFIFSPGMIGNLYDVIGIKFNGAKLKKNTGDGVQLSIDEIKEHYKKSHDFVFIIDYIDSNDEQKETIKNISEIISIKKYFNISQDFLHQMFSYYGSVDFYKKIFQKLLDEKNRNQSQILLRIKDAKNALDFYFKELNFQEDNTFIYKNEEGPEYTGKILRSFSYKYNVPITFAESMDNRKQAFASIKIKYNPLIGLNEYRSFFNKLSEGGKVLTKFEINFTGNLFGEVIDKYNVHWEIKIGEINTWKEVSNERKEKNIGC
ncbi:MAG: hypothetical protein NC236_00540 [Mycoplasma sp.]|nr:hypothetical protein [Mycoplasma sp.]